MTRMKGKVKKEEDVNDKDERKVKKRRRCK